VLDSGALIALERGDRSMWVRIKDALRSEQPLLTHGGVVGQVWRGGSRQARLAQLLPSLTVRALDEQLGRAAGELLGSAGGRDVIDAVLVLLARDGDLIVTSDPGDLRALAGTAGVHVDLIPV
jgi:hypothetical protein